MTTTGKKPAFELEMDRVIDAPRARVFEAWAKPEQIARWFAPRPFQLIVHRLDLRTGGGFSMAMRAPDGAEHAFSGRYLEVVPGAKIVWTGEFSEGPADQMTTVVTFADEAAGKKTRLHVTQTFHVMTPMIEQATKGAKQGWGMTLDQLGEFVTGAAA
ncbi:MAG TPA: SRPBCC domain-containing protein [Planctomycetota bacterium]|nr:SRPBCC domain-containing protein [Planctomycetota bacterium]